MSALDTPKDESRVLPAAGAGNLEAAASTTISGDLVKLLSEQCERAKGDLDKNWMYQIISLGVGLGLIYGLGALLSKKLLDDPGHERILDILMPMVNLYFFMRFGLLATYFSRTRIALEQTVEKYRNKNAIDDSYSIISETNSYFEPYLHKQGYLSLYLYYAFVPIVMGSNQAISFILLYNLTGSSVLLIIYAIPLFFLYKGYYEANDRQFKYLKALIPLAILVGILVCILVYVYPSVHLG